MSVIPSARIQDRWMNCEEYLIYNFLVKTIATNKSRQAPSGARRGCVSSLHVPMSASCRRRRSGRKTRKTAGMLQAKAPLEGSWRKAPERCSWPRCCSVCAERTGPSLPLVSKGPARERCLWQSKRPQRLGSRLPWRTATRAGKA